MLTEYTQRQPDADGNIPVPPRVLKAADKALREARYQFQRGIDAATHKLTGKVKP